MARAGKGRATERYDPHQHGAPPDGSGGRVAGSRRAARATEIAIEPNPVAPTRTPKQTVRATQRYEPKDRPQPAPPPSRAGAEAVSRKAAADALRSPPRAPTLARPPQSQPVPSKPAVAKVAKATPAPPKPDPPPPPVETPDPARTESKGTASESSGAEARLPAVGDTIEDRYRIVRPIGVGGMGHVFLVEQVRLQKQLALKILSPEVLALTGGESQKARFLREARASSRLQHPGIVEVIDFGSTQGGLPFIVMEYLSGEDLAERLDRAGPMQWPDAKNLIVQVLEALEVAHEHGVVHRDIKPENCFLSRSGSTETVKLVDFGIAKVLTEVGGAGPLTQRGELLGTPQYMSPEQALGRPVDNRSDVYAVGVLLYELLSGMPPFDDGTPMEVLTNQITTPPPPLAERALGLPEGAAAVVAKALAKEPGDRYASVRAMIDAIEQVGTSTPHEPLETGPSSSMAPEPPPAEPPRSGAAWVLVAVLGLAAIAGAAVWAFSG